MEGRQTENLSLLHNTFIVPDNIWISLFFVLRPSKLTETYFCSIIKLLFLIAQPGLTALWCCVRAGRQQNLYLTQFIILDTSSLI